jgi:hypothetical protein
MGSTYPFDLSRRPEKPGRKPEKIFESNRRDNLIYNIID